MVQNISPWKTPKCSILAGLLIFYNGPVFWGPQRRSKPMANPAFGVGFTAGELALRPKKVARGLEPRAARPRYRYFLRYLDDIE